MRRSSIGITGEADGGSVLRREDEGWEWLTGCSGSLRAPIHVDWVELLKQRVPPLGSLSLCQSLVGVLELDPGRCEWVCRAAR